MGKNFFRGRQESTILKRLLKSNKSLQEEQKQKFQLLAEFKADGFRFPGLDIDTRLTIIQLVPSSDFFHMYDKQIAHDKHNRAIMWAHIYHMSWEPIEDRIRKYAEVR